jgi:hypothetical protein
MSLKKNSVQNQIVLSAVDISPPAVQVAVEPLAVNVQVAARLSGVPHWTINESILTGALKAKWAGRSRIILLADLNSWIVSLDDVSPSTAPSIVRRQEARARAKFVAVEQL